MDFLRRVKRCSRVDHTRNVHMGEKLQNFDLHDILKDCRIQAKDVAQAKYFLSAHPGRDGWSMMDNILMIFTEIVHTQNCESTEKHTFRVILFDQLADYGVATLRNPLQKSRGFKLQPNFVDFSLMSFGFLVSLDPESSSISCLLRVGHTSNESYVTLETHPTTLFEPRGGGLR